MPYLNYSFKMKTDGFLLYTNDFKGSIFVYEESKKKTSSPPPVPFHRGPIFTSHSNLRALLPPTNPPTPTGPCLVFALLPPVLVWFSLRCSQPPLGNIAYGEKSFTFLPPG